MPLAEVIVRRGDRGPVQFPADDVTTRFEAVIAERGPVGVPIPTLSWSQARGVLGDHTGYSTLRPTESYYAEGGTRAVLSRVVGPAARAASLALRDRDGRTVLTVRAEGPGAWYHAIRVTARAATGDDRTLTVTLDGAELASGTVVDEQQAQDLIARAGLVTAEIGVGVWPLVVVSDQPLTGGDDDRANVRDAHVIAALAVFDSELGAGSVCASGWTTVPVHAALAAHARAGPDGHNRFARADLPDVASAATLIAHAVQIRALPDARYIQLLAGYPTVTVAGVTIPVAPSGHLTGREALTDALAGAGPGQPCAWSFGEFATAAGVSQRWSRSDREQMLAAGITIIVQDAQGRVYAEDAITAIDSTRWPAFAEVSAMRVTMAIHAQCEVALRARVRQLIDGRGHLAAATTGDLVGICSAWYARDALYGETAADAFRAQVTADVGRGRAPRLVGHLELRPSPSAQTVDLTITQVAAGDTI